MKRFCLHFALNKPYAALLRRLCLLLAVFTCAGAQAQQPVYLKYDVGSGLPGNIIYCAAQDENGMVWFGTDKGLVCFDGIRFQTYGVAEGLPDPEVLNLMPDSRGRLWISCFEKKPCYRFKGKFYTEHNDPLLRNIDLNSAILDYYEEKGRGIWISGYSRPVYFLADTATTYHPEMRFVYKSAILGFGKIGGQLMHLNRDSLFLIEEFKKTASIHLGDILYTRNFQDFLAFDNRLLLSANGYTELMALQNGRLQITRSFEGTGGRLFLDREGIPWMSSTQFGCIRLNSLLHPDQPDERYLDGKKVNQFFEDKDGGKWFCTYGDGIYYLPLNAAVNYNASNSTLSDNITALFFDGKKIWFGDDESTIYTIEDGRCQNAFRVSAAPGLNRIRGITLLQDHALIASDRGVYLHKNGVTTLAPRSSASKFVITQGNSFYYGTSNTLLHRTIEDDTFEPIMETRTTAAALDATGALWVGSLNGFYTDKDHFSRNWAVTYPELKSRIVAIAANGKDGLWIATSTAGLLRATLHDGNIIDIVQINDTLSKPIANIQSIFNDEGRRVWLATNNGVYGIDRQWQVLHYNKNNGLAANDVNAVLVLRDTLWAATVSGLSRLPILARGPESDFPTLVSYLRYQHPDGERYFNLLDSMPGRKEFLIDPQSSLIEIGYGGLDYASHLNMRFRCVVKKYLPPLRWITFDNLLSLVSERFQPKVDSFQTDAANLNFGVSLPSGKYVMDAYAINASNVASRRPDTLVFIKKPFWYQTVWFILLIWLLLIWGIRRMMRVFGENRKLQTRISELQLQAIKLQINPHFIGNSINAIQKFFFPPDFLKANAYIEIFTRLLRTTMTNAEKVFYPLEQEVSYLEDYLTMTCLRFGEQFDYEIKVEPEVSLELPFPVMVLQPLVENATIHGFAPKGTSFLRITIEDREGKVICSILDNGPGINQTKARANRKKSHVSKGLSLTYDKVQTLNDLYKIDAALSITDVTEETQGQHGTLVVFSYSPRPMGIVWQGA